MLDSTSLLRVTEGFYSAALGLGTWAGALDSLGDVLRADHVFLYSATRSPFFVAGRVDERELSRSLAIWGQFDADGPRTERVRTGAVALGSMLMPDETYVRSQHYNELVRPMGGRYAVFAKATAVAAGTGFYICRSEKRSDFSREEADVTAMLLPHLSLAVALRSRVAKAADGAAASLLEAFDGPALICDEEAGVIGANARARALLETADGIALWGTRLVAMLPDETVKLRRAIAEALEAGRAGMPQTRRIRLQRRPGRLALSLRLVPASQLGEAAGNPRSVTIFIGEPDAELVIDRGAVAETFGLAPREAEIACLLAMGKSVIEIAGDTGLRAGSVRTYLKRIFYKTDARSQPALVALLRGFV
jgi:DNA-binding CsgD family transcriptional regulator